MKNFLRFVLLLFVSAALYADSLNDLNGVVAGNLKVPFYNNDRLQAMVFAKSAEYREQLLFGTEVLINLLARNVDTDKVANDQDFQIYPLYSPLAGVAKFWLPYRVLYSDAVIWTKAAVIDRVARSASGNVLVKMRSPLLDLDGIGFYADFRKRQIRVNKEVKTVLRMAECDPREFKEKLPKEYNFLRGNGDMLHLDLAENRIMMIGKVTIENEQARLLCDRLTILLGGEKSKSEDDFSLGAAGITAIYADGHVKIRKLDHGKMPKEQQEALCDHLVFDVAKDRITLTNDKGFPRIVFGEKSFIEGKRMVFFRKSQQAIFPDGCSMQSFDLKEGIRTMSCDYGNLNYNAGVCDFLGHVRMNSMQGSLNGDKMRVFLKKDSVKPQKKKIAGNALIGDMKVNVSEFERALCRGNVQLKRIEKGKVSTLNSASASVDYPKGLLIFEKNVAVHSDSGNLYCQKLDILLTKVGKKQEFRNATATGTVRIERIDPDGKAELTAPRGFFDYQNNKIEFSEKVHCIKGKSTLDCRKLELFLADQKGNRRENIGIPGVMESGGNGKTLDHIWASGNVRMVDGSNTLNADSCKIFFLPAKPGDAKKPGFFQSGSLRLAKVLCDGNIQSTSKGGESGAPELKSVGTRTLLAQHSVTDLVRHTSVFTDKVSMFDQEKRLDCDKMEIFAAPVDPGKKNQPKVSSPDDDPFDLPAENSVPKEVVFNGNMQLKKVISSGNVVVTRKESGKTNQQLFCDKATFNGDNMIVVCESTPPKRPRLQAQDMIQTAEQYRILLREERLDAIGETETLNPSALEQKE